MGESFFLADCFEAERPGMRAVAYRMLGSLAEAEDAVQEAWLKLSRADVSDVKNLGAWLTTVVGRICLDMLRSRTSRREDPLPEQDRPVPLPNLVVTAPACVDPEQEVLIADSVGIALMIVLETLSPDERLALVLHDMFDVPFDDIAPVLGRTAVSTRQLASRARRRVQGAAPTADTDNARKRDAVDAFLTASRGGDFEALLAVLHPAVVARSDGGTLVPSILRRGAADVASQAICDEPATGERRSSLRWSSCARTTSGHPAGPTTRPPLPGALISRHWWRAQTRWRTARYTRADAIRLVRATAQPGHAGPQAPTEVPPLCGSG